MSQLDMAHEILIMNSPRIYVDFNEMLEDNLVLLSQQDTKQDSSGNIIQLHAGLKVHVYMDDVDQAGQRDNLIADGMVERHPGVGWGMVAKWCCRIDSKGIRHESDEKIDHSSKLL